MTWGFCVFRFVPLVILALLASDQAIIARMSRAFDEEII